MMKRLGHALAACAMPEPASPKEFPAAPRFAIDPAELGPDLGSSEGSLEAHCKSGAAFVDRQGAHEVKQPADGSCLFHALCFGLNDGTNASKLRREICRYIVEHPDMEIAGLPLKDWVRLDCGRSLHRYAAKIARGAQGGAIEIEVFSRLKGMNVHVYERCSGGYRRTCCFDGGNPSQSRGTAHILYRRRCHYDALVLEREFAKL